MADVVAFTFAPKIVSGVQAKVPPPAESVPHENTPVVDAFTSQGAEFRAETMRFVEDAIPETESAVVVAPVVTLTLAKVEAVLEVAKRAPTFMKPMDDVEVNSPPCMERAEVVAFSTTSFSVVGVQAKVPPPAESVPHENTPVVLAFTSQAAEFRAETMRFVEDAIPETESAVVVAPVVTLTLAKVEAVLEVAKRAPTFMKPMDDVEV